MSTANPRSSAAAFMDSLERGDVLAALGVVDAERAAGTSLSQIAIGIIGPAQVTVGHRWQTATWTVADEHAASGISEAVVHLLAGSLSPARSDRPPIVLTCAENEWHTIPALLAAIGLREAGWRVVYLGASMPGDQLRHFLTTNKPLALAISCSLPLNLPGVRSQVAQAHALGIPVVAGGRAFDSAGRRAAAVGLDAVAGAGSDVNAVLEGWLRTTPTFPPSEPGPGTSVADRLRADRESLAERAFGVLEANLPGMALYDLRQRRRTLEDLGYTVDFLAAALDLDDRSVMTEYLTWLTDLLTHRNVPRAVIATSMEALATALRMARHPLAEAWLMEAAAVIGTTEQSPGSGGLRSSVTRPGGTGGTGGIETFESLLPTLRAGWERSSSINAGALAVAEAVAGIGDPVAVAEAFTRAVAQELALGTAVVVLPLDGEVATLGASDDPTWARHPPHLLAAVVAGLTTNRPQGFRLGGRQGLSVPVEAGTTGRVAVVAVGITREAASDAALVLTALAKVLGPALRAANLEQDSRGKSAFLSLIGHELRTPLAAILGYTDLLETDVRAPLGPRARRYLSRIRVGGTRLLTLVENVMDLVGLESGNASTRSQLFGLRALLVEAAPATDTDERGVRVVVNCSPDLALRTGRHHLARALQNIIANAVQFSPPGAVVRVTARRRGANTAIHVRDVGRGMEPAQLARVGQPFLQVSRGLTRTHDGLGLGLVTARAHLHAIGAHIHIESAPGRGTKVVVEVPAKAEGHSPAKKGPPDVRR